MPAKKKTTKKTETGDTADTRAKSIDVALREIKTKFGEEAIMTYGSGKVTAIASIPTGSLGLDAALGIGGLPRGRIVEVFGP